MNATDRLRASLDDAERKADAFERLATKALGAEERVKAARAAVAWAARAKSFRAEIAALESA